MDYQMRQTGLNVQPKIRSMGGVSEGFAIELTDAGAKSQVSREVSELMGPDWTLRAIGGSDTDFELRQTKGKISARQAWNKAYKLRAIPGVAYAEPLFATTVSDNPAWANDESNADRQGRSSAGESRPGVEPRCNPREGSVAAVFSRSGAAPRPRRDRRTSRHRLSGSPRARGKDRQRQGLRFCLRRPGRARRSRASPLHAGAESRARNGNRQRHRQSGRRSAEISGKRAGLRASLQARK